MPEFSLEQLVEEMIALIGKIPIDRELSSLSRRNGASVRQDLETVVARLQRVLLQLDPIKQPEYFFDPGDPTELGRLIAQTLLLQRRHELDGLGAFYGSGVYAIYYKGDFGPYRDLSGSETAIYIGKVDPMRQGATTPKEQGDCLWRRLVRDHLKNIKRAENLRAGDFECRYLVVKSAWQVTAENILINRFKPVWNNETGICYGFGKHGDAPGTRANARSPWDTLHPGRPWAWRDGNVPNLKSPEQIASEVEEHLRKYPPEHSEPKLL